MVAQNIQFGPNGEEIMVLFDSDPEYEQEFEEDDEDDY